MTTPTVAPRAKASQKFRLNDVVRATPAYREAFGPPYEGLVVGFPRTFAQAGRDELVRVLRKYRCRADVYHMDFWEVVPWVRGFTDGAGI